MVANRKRLVVPETKKQAKAVKGKAKTGNKSKSKDVGLKLSSRLFSIPKKSRILFVSSANSQESPSKIISNVVEKAKSDGCQVVIHAGLSFRIAGRESAESILNTIAERIRGTKVRRYLAELYNDKKTSDPAYYIISQDLKKISKVKCLKQQFSESSKRDEARAFAKALGTLEPTRIAMPNEYPCLLLVCGENNLFNKKNRGGGDFIEDESLSHGVLTSLREIQKKQWCIINPSHKPYRGRKTGEAIMAFHKTCSENNRVKCVFAVNNRGSREPSEANQTAVWQNGSRTQAQVVYNHRGLCMYRFDLAF
ncbi:MAG: hypothetical protein QME44_00650 [Thermodesulfobacteriota bacterium]|nr:hypothetical protein [Thermodesulfobacteriota bacterium]